MKTNPPEDPWSPISIKSDIPKFKLGQMARGYYTNKRIFHEGTITSIQTDLIKETLYRIANLWWRESSVEIVSETMTIELSRLTIKRLAEAIVMPLDSDVSREINMAAKRAIEKL